MENFVFPDENKKKIDKNVRIDEHFSYFDWNSAKKLKKVFLFTLEKQLNRPSCFELVCRGKCINQKKLNVKTSSMPYTKRTNQSCYLQNVLTGHKGVTNTGCQTRYYQHRKL